MPRITAQIFPFVTMTLFLLCATARAGGPPFSYMTLNGIEQFALAVEDLEPELAVYDVTPDSIAAATRARLEAAGIAVIDGTTVLTAPRAALLRIRVITNKDSHGFYHLGVKLEVRQKIPLGNPAGGFVSQAVWTAGDNGVMQPNETEKITAMLDRLLGELIADYRAQNG